MRLFSHFDFFDLYRISRLYARLRDKIEPCRAMDATKITTKYYKILKFLKLEF